jgi:membrane-bound lytic murein transglycosylase A
MKRLLWSMQWVLIVGTLAGCASTPLPGPAVEKVARPVPPMPQAAWPADTAALPPAIRQPGSRWQPVRWSELPEFTADNLLEAWPAWLASCERPGPVFAPLCPEIRQLGIATMEQQREWMVRRLQPYRVESAQGESEGLLTAYYEPIVAARRLPDASHRVPLYRAPAGLALRKPWFTRQESETLPQAQAALRGQEIAWLADPVDALILQIQGSGRLQITEPDGSSRLVRLAFGGSNDQPYRSVGRWLLDQGAVRDASWPSIKNWVAQNPQRIKEFLWSNPRLVFFREEAVPAAAQAQGPRGAQGVPLTPGRSIAVDRDSIPYGTPVWLASDGPSVVLRRLVLAQDTGNAIRGAVRADYFLGTGDQAGELAGRLRQSLRLWVLWPRPRS